MDQVHTKYTFENAHIFYEFKKNYCTELSFLISVMVKLSTSAYNQDRKE